MGFKNNLKLLLQVMCFIRTSKVRRELLAFAGIREPDESDIPPKPLSGVQFSDSVNGNGLFSFR